MSQNEQISFEPNEELLTVLTALGISRNAAVRALYNTGNYNADVAAAWIFENQHHNLDLPLTQETLEEESSGDEEERGNFVTLPGGSEEDYKMVLVVNTALSMGVGKVAAQVGHGAVGLYRELIENQEQFGEMLLMWDDCGCKKIVLKGNDANHLQALKTKAQSFNLPTFPVYDAGKTQVEAGSFTVLAVMGKSRDVDQVTGDLSLF